MFIKGNVFILFTLLVYAVLTVICIDNCYFWDNIQQTSYEAHWFYDHGFKSLILPGPNDKEAIIATGYHAPFMSIVTALLWDLFGYDLAISHLFVFAFALVFIYNVERLAKIFVAPKYAGWVLLAVAFEPTVLSQFSIASPDFIMLSATVLFFRGLFESKRIQQALGIFFLCVVNMRGVFWGIILFMAAVYLNFIRTDKKLSFKALKEAFIPFIPTFIILAIYYSYYLLTKGWFFKNSAFEEHYSLPTEIQFIVKHFLSLIIRVAENGRLFIWLLACFCVYQIKKRQLLLDEKSRILAFALVCFFGMFLVFVCITQMPFSSRYFMPAFSILTILALSFACKYFQPTTCRNIFIFLFIFEVTGHFWIYPDPISKSWESTLAHLPYYELRKDCFNYIDSAAIDYNDLSGGFCLNGKRKYAELSDNIKLIDTSLDSKYYLFSNICNEEDSILFVLKDPNQWVEIKRFEKGFVYLSILQKKESFCKEIKKTD